MVSLSKLYLVSLQKRQRPRMGLSWLLCKGHKSRARISKVPDMTCWQFNLKSPLMKVFLISCRCILTCFLSLDGTFWFTFRDCNLE
ncbi:hypothetical protein GDO81_025074 [Engystomops pustulosus]|uniref:Uncharacterized protein n=1 Tax=Engystomops pustulosus TaxID=76066 RepID=A0AAV6Z2P5_ENGPU|nr:hypothetical protein GDO81_025074 [Engystomops pustulosus]